MLKKRKPLNATTIKAMKHEEKAFLDIKEDEGLPLSFAKVGRFPSISLAEASGIFQDSCRINY